MSATEHDVRTNAPKLTKKFKCRQCDRLFTRSEHRSRHELSHNPDRPWKCTECSSSFVRRDLLLRHTRTVHGNTNTAPPVKRAKPNPQTPMMHSVGVNEPIHVNPNGVLDHHHVSDPQLYQHVQSPAASTLLSLANLSSAADVSTAMLMTEMQKQTYTGMGLNGPNQPVAGSHSGPDSSQLSNGRIVDQYAMAAANPQGYSAGLPRMRSDLPLMPPSTWSSTGVVQTVDSRGPKTLNSLSPAMWRPDHTSPGQFPVSPRRNNDPMSNDSGDDFASISKMLRDESDELFRQIPRGNGSLESGGHDHGESRTPGFGSSQVGTPLKSESGISEPSYGSVPQIGPDFDIDGLVKILRPCPTSDGPVNLTRLQLDRYLSAYFNLFHPLVPMLHMQTFDIAQVPPSLFCAICAVGALLCREEATADALSYNSRMLINMLHQPGGDNSRLLITAQSLIIIIVYSAYSGDRAALSAIGTLRTSLVSILEGIIDSSNLNDPDRLSRDPRGQSWQLWTKEQEIIRTYFCALIAITTLTAIFKYPASITIESLPQYLPLPCSEVLWNASFRSEERWRSSLEQDLATTSSTSLGQLMRVINRVGETDFEHMWQSGQEIPTLNPFSVRILGNIMFLTTTKVPMNAELAKMRLRQIQFWKFSAKDPTPGMGQGMLLSSATTPFLDFFEPLDVALVGDTIRSSTLIQAIKSQQHPMIILSHVLLGLTKLQLVLDLGIVRENLQFHGAEHVAEAALSCADLVDGDEKLESLLSVVVACFDVLRVPLVLGVPLAQSFLSSPPSGSVTGQSLIIGFELVLALVIWCHRVDKRLKEPDGPHGRPLSSRVRVAFNWVERTCLEAGHQKVDGALAPTLADIAASSYEAVTTWRLSNVMARSLRLLSRGLINKLSAANQTASYGPGYNDGPVSYEYLSYS